MNSAAEKYILWHHLGHVSMYVCDCMNGEGGWYQLSTLLFTKQCRLHMHTCIMSVTLALNLMLTYALT